MQDVISNVNRSLHHKIPVNSIYCNSVFPITVFPLCNAAFPQPRCWVAIMARYIGNLMWTTWSGLQVRWTGAGSVDRSKKRAQSHKIRIPCLSCCCREWVHRRIKSSSNYLIASPCSCWRLRTIGGISQCDGNKNCTKHVRCQGYSFMSLQHPATPVMPRLNCKSAKTQRKQENKGRQGQSWLFKIKSTVLAKKMVLPRYQSITYIPYTTILTILYYTIL